MEAIRAWFHGIGMQIGPKADTEKRVDRKKRLSSVFLAAITLKNLPYVYRLFANPWIKNFNDLAAMVGMIEQPWWHYDNERMALMTGAKCREIGTHTKNMEARSTPPNARSVKKILFR